MAPDNKPNPSSQPRPWGSLSTFGWAVLAVLVSNVASVAFLWASDPGALDTILADPTKSGPYFAILICLANLVQVAVLLPTARFAGWSIIDYFGLTWPSARETTLAVTVMAGFVLGYDALTYAIDRDVVSPFQIDVYRNASNSGGLVMMWLAMVIYAPVGEELMFRGFLYRGWAQTPQAVLPAVLAIATIWAAVHVQYDWFGMLQILMIGLILGWVRWRTGSTLLTMLLHGLVNAWATFETVVAINAAN
jgi:membrane protease YdiL (CAAX protease family)